MSRQPVTATTWHFTQQTLLEPLNVTGASAFCFNERYRDVLSQNLDENNSTRTSPDCCTYVTNSVTVRECVCVCYIQFDGYTSVYIVPVCSYMESNSVLDADDDTTSSAVSPTRRGAHENTYGIWNRRRNVYASHEVWILWLGCLSITIVHGACDRPRCLRVVNSGIHAPHPLDLQGVIIKPPKAPVLHNFEHLKHLGPCRQCSLFS